MQEKEPNTNHSFLFRKNDDSRTSYLYNEAIKHPFVFIEDELKVDDIQFAHYKFEEGMEYYKHLKSKQSLAFEHFEYEMIFLERNKTSYLNELVDILIKSYKTIHKKLIKTSKECSHLRMLASILKNTLERIFISHHLELNYENGKFLSRWYHLKEPIVSFRFTKYQEEKRLNNLIDKYLRGYDKFISFETSNETFRALFQGKPLTNKINWKGSKSTLYFFIKLLIRENIIRDTKKKHWKVVSQFFLLKGETLTSKDFLNQKETQNPEKRENIEKFVSALKN